MPANPNKLSQFWHELKRRKVVRVITIYAAIAFVILQLVEILAPSLRLPEWTMNFILVLLIVGFIITVIVSWIYDIHPEGGIVKTEPTHQIKTENITKSSNSWKIASYISFVVIVGLIVLNVIPRTKRVIEKEILEKSIAVLPFRNDSPNEERMYFINGTMEAILDNLCKIKDLRVPGRTSVEQYRDNPKPIPTVAEEMNVSYILEGSGHRDGNNVRLIVQLLDGRKDQHLWSKTYDTDIEDIFSMQSEIALLVAAEIEAIISPEEKQLIDKPPTANLTAYDFYLRGREEHEKYWLDGDNREALERAEDLYHKALEYDSTFALAYTGLAWVYWNKHYWETYLAADFMDSALVLANKALSYDDQLAEAYVIRGNYYVNKGQNDKGIEEYDIAIKFNPNHYMAYTEKGWAYADLFDKVKSIENFHKAASLVRGQELIYPLNSLHIAYSAAGFLEKSNYFAHQVLELEGDSISYYGKLARNEVIRENYANALIYLHKSYDLDSNNLYIIGSLGQTYMHNGQFEESLKYYEKFIQLSDASDRGVDYWREILGVAYAYYRNGYKEEADYYFDETINFFEEVIKLNRQFFLQGAYYILGAVYAIRGEKDKAYENLRGFNQWPIMPSGVMYMKNDPWWDNIKNEPEFQQIVREWVLKYEAEHERIRKWLEENDML